MRINMTEKEFRQKVAEKACRKWESLLLDETNTKEELWGKLISSFADLSYFTRIITDVLDDREVLDFLFEIYQESGGQASKNTLGQLITSRKFPYGSFIGAFDEGLYQEVLRGLNTEMTLRWKRALEVPNYHRGIYNETGLALILYKNDIKLSLEFKE